MNKYGQWLMLWMLLAIPLAHAGTVTYVYTDPQGTPLAEADANGNITARFEYTPYGVPMASVGAAPNGVGYTGHVNDPDTGLVYMQARYYDPAMGRFLSVDPVTAYDKPGQNFNRYWYANNNPYRFTDPDGRQSYENMSLTGQMADDMYRRGEIDEKQLVDAWAQGAEAGAKGAYIGLSVGSGFGALRSLGAMIFRTSTVEIGSSLAQANKIHHIFSQPRHNLAGIAKAMGGEVNAFKAIENAAAKVVDLSKAGKFEAVVKVSGQQVTVRGSVVDGQVKIGTAFMKPPPPPPPPPSPQKFNP